MLVFIQGECVDFFFLMTEEKVNGQKIGLYPRNETTVLKGYSLVQTVDQKSVVGVQKRNNGRLSFSKALQADSPLSEPPFSKQLKIYWNI